MTEPIGFDIAGLAWESGLDRHDVAIRAVWFLYRNGMWKELTMLGVEPRRQAEPWLEYARDTLPSHLRDQDIVWLLRRCPWVYGAAVEILRRYQVVSAASLREMRKYERRAA